MSVNPTEGRPPPPVEGAKSRPYGLDGGERGRREAFGVDGRDWTPLKLAWPPKDPPIAVPGANVTGGKDPGGGDEPGGGRAGPEPQRQRFAVCRY